MSGLHITALLGQGCNYINQNLTMVLAVESPDRGEDARNTVVMENSWIEFDAAAEGVPNPVDVAVEPLCLTFNEHDGEDSASVSV